MKTIPLPVMHGLHARGLVLLCTLLLSIAPLHAQPITDHHIHLRSETMSEAGKKWQEAVGYNSDPTAGLRWTQDTLLTEMDEVGIDRAQVLSFAYMFAAPELEYEDEYERVRDENDWIASQAAASDRLVAFCGLPPLAEYAPDEVDRCAEEPSVRGIKLHLFNSDVNLSDEDELQHVIDLIDRADDHGLYTIIHPQTRESEYGVPQLIRFLEAVAPKVDQTAVQLAHLGLNTPMTDEQMEKLDALAETLEALDPEAERFFLDPSYVVIPPSLVGDDISIREANQRAGNALRTLGLDRIVFGSDSNSPGQMEAHLEALNEHAGLDDKEVQTILSNQFPAFRDDA